MNNEIPVPRKINFPGYFRILKKHFFPTTHATMLDFEGCRDSARIYEPFDRELMAAMKRYLDAGEEMCRLIKIRTEEK